MKVTIFLIILNLLILLSLSILPTTDRVVDKYEIENVTSFSVEEKNNNIEVSLNPIDDTTVISVEKIIYEAKEEPYTYHFTVYRNCFDIFSLTFYKRETTILTIK